jgi:glutathione synthase/RimK-type ligase-like ATP-grasp enzyme
MQPSSAAPLLIYLALNDWFSSARLPRYLSRAGFRLIAVCTPASPLAQVRHFEHHAVIAPEELTSTLEDLTKRFRPELIVSADEGAIYAVHALQRQCGEAPSTLSAPLCQLLRRSLGKPRDRLLSKQRINEIAGGLGIAVPRQRVITQPSEADAFAREVGYPIVLKKENTHGGMGVLLCRDAAETVTNVFRLRAAGLRQRGFAKYGVGTVAQIAPIRSLLATRRGEALIAQEYVQGDPAFRTFVAREGRVLAGFSAIAERVDPVPFGSSTVVRFVERPDMAPAVAALAEALGITGFAGVDFIVEAGTGRAMLLELNARVTPTTHLGSLLGIDLCAELMDDSEAAAARFANVARAQRTVALFPGELMRDAASDYLRSAYHDVPQDEPELIAAWRASLPQRSRRLRSLPLLSVADT